MPSNQYYSTKYESCVPLNGIGTQIKDYLDKKFDEINVGEEMEQNIINNINTSKDEIISSVTDTVNNSTSAITSGITSAVESANSDMLGKINCMITNSTNETACNICYAKQDILDALSGASEESGIVSQITDVINASKEELTNTITEKATEITNKVESKGEEVLAKIDEKSTEITDNVNVKAEELSDKVDEKSNEILTKVDEAKTEITTKVDDGFATQAEALEKARQDLIAEVNNTNDLMKAGFSDLNTAVIANKEDAVYRINDQALSNKNEILDAINYESVPPFNLYGGAVLNILKPDINSIETSDVAKLTKISKSSLANAVFSIRIDDIAVTGMNDDPTGQLYNDAKAQNEKNIVFAYPSEYPNTSVYDSVNNDISKYLGKKEMDIDGVKYTVAMLIAKVSNLYDPQWEEPMAYTLNYNVQVKS